MKQKMILFIFLIFSTNSYATEQISDLLIFGKNNVYLKSFPLEGLEMKYKPFHDNNNYLISTACWRGYQAVWKIIDNKLYLEKITECHDKTKEENIIELFERNGIQYQERDGMIFANWCTMDLYNFSISLGNRHNKRILYNGWGEKIIRRKILKIDNGIVTINRL